MLETLHIRNYALINDSKMVFAAGFTIITGETGAGKSILLGALGLIVGNRADVNVLSNKEEKCVVEAEFSLPNTILKKVFEENDVDFEKQCIIRREILPNGKSRAFVNDTPVQLAFLKTIGEQLIDIHSQHETLLLKDKNFQLDVVDAYAKTQEEKNNYQSAFKKHSEAQKAFHLFLEDKQKNTQDLDYWTFQLEELTKAELKEGETELLEEELERVTHSAEILQNFQKALFELSESDENMISRLIQVNQGLDRISNINTHYADIAKRIQSVRIELEDLTREMEAALTDIEVSPERQEWIEDRLGLIFSLQKKHQSSNTSDLLQLQDELQEKVNAVVFADEKEKTLKKAVEKAQEEMQKAAIALSEKRLKAAPQLGEDIQKVVRLLGMENAVCAIQVTAEDKFSIDGIDKIQFLFTANVGMVPQPIEKIASGGEISRYMLALKAILSGKKVLPTILFDEIDTGISGNIAHKVAQVLHRMANNMQIIAITHLPQMAGKGNVHLKVQKREEKGKTVSFITTLNEEERVLELASMLSGEKVTDEAIQNARTLLQ